MPSGSPESDHNLVADRLQHLAGKYMTFKLAEEAYGAGIQSVREIIRVLEITRVPPASAFIRGVSNLRGKVIPVIDLRLKFGMTSTEITNQTVVIVVQVVDGAHQLTMGVLVDQVLEVLSIDLGQIEATPELGGARWTTRSSSAWGRPPSGSSSCSTSARARARSYVGPRCRD